MYLFFVLLAVSCLSTYLLFSDVGSYSRNATAVISTLYLDIVFILILMLLGSAKIMEVWASRHNRGSFLTLRFISIFSLLSIVPSIIMCVFSAFFFHKGIESWFNKRNLIVLQESLSVAESYLLEHKRNTLNDCIAISRAVEYRIEHMMESPENNPELFAHGVGLFLDDLCGLKGLDSAILLDSYLNIIAHSRYSVALHFLNVDYKTIKKIEILESKGLVIDPNPNKDAKNIVAASCFRNANGYFYVVIGKNIDYRVLSQAKHARIAYDEYLQLREDRSSLEIAFIFVFLGVGVLLLLAAIAVALVYSWRIVKPISNLIDVSEKIISGNMQARAYEDGSSSYEEITLLSKTFNQMIDQVCYQRQDLEKINQKLDERIKFTNSVLEGVSSGVIGIDNDAIFVWNTTTEKLLGDKMIFGENVGNVFPGVTELLMSMEGPSIQREIQFKKGNEIRLFSVRIESLTPQKGGRFVITFTDLTDMMIAQRKAAWSDVARRVAHEIKNPLTPIQLSAERIRRKYLPQISSNPEIFEALVNVIIRQVGDIKRLIDEFNFFARLPEPKLKWCDLQEVCQQAVFLMQNADKDVNVTFSTDSKSSYKIKADERLLHQSIVNLIQNSINVLITTAMENKKVWATLTQTPIHVKISVEDNGPGFPKEKMASLATPYFTLMPKGTGLGLAIVKKIVQDHGGELLFEESIHGGAKVTIQLPFTGEQ